MSQVELRDRPVFICGHPRSGISLLRNLLDGHPQLVVYPEETSFFRRYLKEAAKTSMEVCGFLGIEDSFTLRVPTRNRNPWEGNSVFADTFEAVSSITTGRWKTELSNTDVCVIETMTGKLMCRLNYTPGVGKLFRVMLRVTWWRIKRSLDSLFRKVHNESDLFPIFIERAFDHD
jgi:hypothetical protein